MSSIVATFERFAAPFLYDAPCEEAALLRAEEFRHADIDAAASAFDLGAADDFAKEHAIRHGDANGDAAGEKRAGDAEFLGKDAGQLFGVAHVVVIRAAGFREGGHEVLVVIVAEPDRRHRDALFAQFAAEPCEVRSAFRADIREPIGKQDHPIDALLVEVPANLPRAERHARVQRGAAAGADAVDHGLQLLAMPRAADPFGRGEDFGFVGIDDEREEIVVVELIDRDARGLARLLNFRSLHRAAAVEHHGEVHRHAMTSLGLSRFDLDLDDDFARTA